MCTIHSTVVLNVFGLSHWKEYHDFYWFSYFLLLYSTCFTARLLYFATSSTFHTPLLFYVLRSPSRLFHFIHRFSFVEVVLFFDIRHFPICLVRRSISSIFKSFLFLRFWFSHRPISQHLTSRVSLSFIFNVIFLSLIQIGSWKQVGKPFSSSFLYYPLRCDCM